MDPNNRAARGGVASHCHSLCPLTCGSEAIRGLLQERASSVSNRGRGALRGSSGPSEAAGEALRRRWGPYGENYGKPRHKMTLAKNTALTALAGVILSGGRLFLNIYLARHLRIEAYGAFAFSQWAIEMLALLFAAGVPGAATRFFAEFSTNAMATRAFERWFLKRALIIIPLAAVAAAGLGMATLPGGGVRRLLLFAGWGGAVASSSLLTARAQGLRRFARITVASTFYILCIFGCLVALRSGHFKAQQAILAVVLATWVNAATLMMPSRSHRSMQPGQTAIFNIEVIGKYAWNVWLAGLVSALVWSRAELAIVKLALGAKALGVYSAGLSIAALATQGLMLLTGALGPHLVQLWGSGRREECISLARDLTDLLAACAAAGVIFILAFAPHLVHMLYGPRYAGADSLLAVLAVGVLGLVASPLKEIVQIETNGAFSRNVNAVGAVILFAAGMIGALRFGLIAPAVVRTAVQCGFGVAAVTTAYWRISSKSLSRGFLLQVCSLVLFSGVAYNMFMFSAMSRAVGFLISMIFLLVILKKCKFERTIMRIARA